MMTMGMMLMMLVMMMMVMMTIVVMGMIISRCERHDESVASDGYKRQVCRRSRDKYIYQTVCELPCQMET